ncbi:hypothetical protein AV530_005607 [Patagioenas fasciata monilis]|uniref:Uncharacterized protein n=1 Tax=Patagioenas fasciata monilis TaxID=372326 RepID=A0A1V4JM10_PATFA|nr:hypothetical protein AV530_005607 [Patagioenas fasciata monilis]
MQDEHRVESSFAALLPRGGELKKNEGCISGDLGASQAAGAQRTVDSREEDGAPQPAPQIGCVAATARANRTPWRNEK